MATVQRCFIEYAKACRDLCYFIVYRGVLLIRPSWVWGHVRLGKICQQSYLNLAGLKVRRFALAVWFGERSVECYKRAIDLEPDELDYYQLTSAMLSSMGRITEALVIENRRQQVQRAYTQRYRLDQLDTRFLIPSAIDSVGVLGNLEGYIKAGILGWRRSSRIKMLVDANKRLCNPHLIRYWGKYVEFVTDPSQIEQLSEVAKYLEDAFNWILTRDNNAFFYPSAATLLNKEWENQNRPSLLSLTADDHERGWNVLNDLGMPKDSWFVCLHVREAGFKDGMCNYDAYRNSDITTYQKAIQTIVDRGGWVVRMGDPTMKPFAPMKQVIDYAHISHRCDWMDVFLCACGRFFISSASGLVSVASAFGVPFILTNWVPNCALSFSSKVLFIPKLAWSRREGRYLTFQELMSPQFSTNCMQYLYDRMGVQLVDNTAEDIDDLVSEMLDRLDNVEKYSDEDRHLQTQFQNLTGRCGTVLGMEDVPISCRIGQNFLKKNRSLLDKNHTM